jgi:hypothetical protein
MDSKKLKINIGKLSKQMPGKPAQHTDDFPKSIGECFHKYLRQSTLWNIQAAAWIYEGRGWPLPLYVNPENIQVGKLHQAILGKWRIPNYKYFTSIAMLRLGKPIPTKNIFQRLRELKPITIVLLPLFLPYVIIKKGLVLIKKRPAPVYYHWFNAVIIAQFYLILDIDKMVIDLFNTNFEYYKEKVINNPLLQNKQLLLKDVFDTYQNQNYAACICSQFPILDFLTREVFNTNKLGRDITSINSMFKAAGYTLNDIDNLKPAGKAVKLNDLMMQKKLTKEEYDNIIKNDFKDEMKLGLPGVALSSFLLFGAKYYDFYRNDTKVVELNRHAIMHGANDAFANQVNCVKLFTYLYLMLEIEPVLRIVFNET